jgi:hypothetical protein
MYIKDKRESFQMYTSVFHVLSSGNHIKFTSKWKQISYEKSDLTQCMNIINGGITKCIIMYGRIPGLPRTISFVRRHF